MYDSMKDRQVGVAEVIEKFGVPPEKMIDLQALSGDSTDNIPGIPGIGPKTAAQLLEEYGDLETLLERAGEIKQNKRRENLIEFADLARISKKLVTLVTDMPIEVPLGCTDPGANRRAEAGGFPQGDGIQYADPQGCGNHRVLMPARSKRPISRRKSGRKCAARIPMVFQRAIAVSASAVMQIPLPSRTMAICGHRADLAASKSKRCSRTPNLIRQAYECVRSAGRS